MGSSNITSPAFPTEIELGLHRVAQQMLAMIELDAQVRVGSEPLLELSEAVSISATVEWAVGDQAGLKFHSPFDMEMLAESRPTVATSDWKPPAYLDPDSNHDDDHWKRLSISQLRQELEGFMKH